MNKSGFASPSTSSCWYFQVSVLHHIINVCACLKVVQDFTSLKALLSATRAAVGQTHLTHLSWNVSTTLWCTQILAGHTYTLLVESCTGWQTQRPEPFVSQLTFILSTMQDVKIDHCKKFKVLEDFVDHRTGYATYLRYMNIYLVFSSLLTKKNNSFYCDTPAMSNH